MREYKDKKNIGTAIKPLKTLHFVILSLLRTTTITLSHVKVAINFLDILHRSEKEITITTNSRLMTDDQNTIRKTIQISLSTITCI